jgi:hypothetical protein
MNRTNRPPLIDHVTRAAETALAAQGYVSPLDILLRIGWLDPTAEKRWQQCQLDCLEDAIQTNPTRVAEAMTLFRSWATQQGLLASETPYVARTSQRQTLRFTRSGDADTGTFYRTHWVSPALPEKKARTPGRPGEQAAGTGGHQSIE